MANSTIKGFKGSSTLEKCYINTDHLNVNFEK